ncbi:MAG: bifunctional 23S rRNA (guanine(2069)-N(7))-methyltransferase RlmK/23S rRNA (guanine(2445)-N(2))-methyltransferase RlmL [Xanthomonadales bacterium]|nr:bifunctional 23S rRNA (guanine(2069)-N(7))-methyltransferase RlmK/23S rRNA (guanine(2445)-N(2))-methyltransferase RlmL [Xanthomonadales bacterium]
MSHSLFAACPRGVEYLLVDEIRGLGGDSVHEGLGGVFFAAGLETAYRVGLYSRLASRLYLELIQGPVASGDELYEMCLDFPWQEHLDSGKSLSVHSAVRGHRAFKDSRFAALRVKDAVVDRIRRRTGARPSVDRRDPDVPLYVFVDRKSARVGVDLMGRALHQRGYRRGRAEAPLKENLAAALVLRSGWLDHEARPLIDPMCGSGTLLIEGALMRLGVPAGLAWVDDLKTGWHGHRGSILETVARQLKADASAAFAAELPFMAGFDQDRAAVEAASDNAERAGLPGRILWRQGRIQHLQRPVEGPGFVLTNPPYGRRLSETESLFDLFRVFGQRLSREFADWRLGVLVEETEPCRAMPFRPERKYQVYNGAIACTFLLFPITGQSDTVGPAVEMVANRLRKNLRKLSKYLKNKDIEAYRLYDADIPEYACAVDVYGDWANIQEYAPPASVAPGLAQKRLRDLIQAVQQVLSLEPQQVTVRQRKRQKGSDQYTGRSRKGETRVVVEDGLRFEVNPHDYLDTGLFLDHRETRAMVRRMAEGKRVLNLFCYTASFAVYAAAGGARSSVSVDLSKTYLAWARRNFLANGMDLQQHKLVRSDCFAFLRNGKSQFDLIVLDPPTFSNSKSMDGSLDIQRDHVALIQLCRQRLSRHGTLVFSTNARKFKLDVEALEGWQVQDVTAKTVPPDFQRRRPHQCWVLSRQPDG